MDEDTKKCVCGADCAGEATCPACGADCPSTASGDDDMADDDGIEEEEAV